MGNSSLTKLKKLREQAQALLSDEQSTQQQQEISRPKKLAYFLARTYRSFSRNRGPVRAAALAYTTVLSLVPLLAVVVGVTTGLLKTENGENKVRDLVNILIEHVAAPLGMQQSPDVAKAAGAREQAVNAIMEYIQKVNSGTLTGTGFLVFVFVAISLLSTIEAAFNDMWGVPRGRSWLTRTVSYWAALTLGPLFLLTAFTINIAIQFKPVTDLLAEWVMLGRILEGFLLPILLLGIAFSALYLLMPNTKVDWRAALVGGFSAAFLFQMNSLLSVHFTSRVVTYSKIYGSLSMVPLLLIGLYVSWLIVLFGGQIAYGFQSRKAYFQEKQADNINQRGREVIAFRLMTLISQRFHAMDRPLTAAELAEQIGVPLKLIDQVLCALSAAGLVVEVAAKETGLVPGGPLDQITAEDILQAMRSGQGQEWITCDGPDREAARAVYQSIERAEKEVASAVTLQELATRDVKTEIRP
jgi:membrane protein